MKINFFQLIPARKFQPNAMLTCSGKLQENDEVNKAFSSVPQCRKTAGEHYVFIALIVTNYSGKL